MLTHTLVRDIVATSRPLESIGFDVSSKEGARLQACRLRLFWLAKGIDVPAIIENTAPPIKTPNGRFRQHAFYGPHLIWDSARRVSEEEARQLREAIEAEVMEVLA